MNVFNGRYFSFQALFQRKNLLVNKPLAVSLIIGMFLYMTLLKVQKWNFKVKKTPPPAGFGYCKTTVEEYIPIFCS